MIEFRSLMNIPKEYDELWIVTRSLDKYHGKIDGVKVKYKPELAPSLDLFHFYLTERAAGRWDEDTFNNKYKPVYLAELRNNKLARASIEELAATKKHIIIACFCANRNMCHRSLLENILKRKRSDIVSM